MENIELIVVDLDNTLLRRDKTISDYSVSVFERVRKYGIITAFATTRSESASARFTRIITPDIFISNGGTLIRKSNEIIYSSPIELSVANDIISKCVKNDAIKQITVESETGYYNTKPIDNEISGWLDFSRLKVTDFRTPIDYGNIYKIAVLSENKQSIQDIVYEHINLKIVGFTGENWYQIYIEGATKANAIMALPFARENIIAFGDDYNDVEMLDICGVGVAMSNAIEECKRSADFICGDCDDDGVAHWIDGMILYR